MMTLNDSDSGGEDLNSEGSIKNENLIDKEAYELNPKSNTTTNNNNNNNKIPNNNHFASYTEKSMMSDIKKNGSTFCSNAQLLKLKRESSSNMMRTKSLQDLPSLSSATGMFILINIKFLKNYYKNI